jgi:hypothetical protein
MILSFFVVTNCNTVREKDNIQALSTEDQQLVREFETAQTDKDTVNCLAYLASSLSANPALFCALVEKASFFSIETLLHDRGFLLVQPHGYNYNFQALCQFNHRCMMAMMERIKTTNSHDQQFYDALKIAGLNLCDPFQRDSFAFEKILVNSNEAALDLLFISNYLKLQPADTSFETALKTVVGLADKKTVMQFLSKSGYTAFNPRTDQYKEFHPEKLAHLSPDVVDVILKKANLTKQ